LSVVTAETSPIGDSGMGAEEAVMVSPRCSSMEWSPVRGRTSSSTTAAAAAMRPAPARSLRRGADRPRTLRPDVPRPRSRDHQQVHQRGELPTAVPALGEMNDGALTTTWVPGSIYKLGECQLIHALTIASHSARCRCPDFRSPGGGTQPPGPDRRRIRPRGEPSGQPRRTYPPEQRAAVRVRMDRSGSRLVVSGKRWPGLEAPFRGSGTDRVAGIAHQRSPRPIPSPSRWIRRLASARDTRL
jgi:hypothetical protein